MQIPEVKIEFILNGEATAVSVPPQVLLVDLLRKKLGLTGTKEGCGIGECGSCTVLVDGRSVNSCLVLAVSVSGKKVTTIEGLSDGEVLHPIQQAFVEEGAVQCGYCTPGMILSAKALLDENPSPSRKEIAVAISGNLCRCTGYTKIINAVSKASQCGQYCGDHTRARTAGAGDKGRETGIK